MHSSLTHLEKNRRPRVHIKYEVETEQGTEEKELPFVVGVLGDFAADNSKSLSNLKEREFITIDKDNFDEIMTKINPGLNLTLDNHLSGDNSSIFLQLSFKALRDFEPDQLITQIEPLRKLKQARDRLRSLLNKTECSESLEQDLELILQDDQQLKQLADKLKIKTNLLSETENHE
ncbi:MAG TPA: type VI secretion system contractile sheath small subunit [Coxiellaceae bacterium]|nr:type VI secretion system contractile sheath small subunit [Coxiellaceae bacterium]